MRDKKSLIRKIQEAEAGVAKRFAGLTLLGRVEVTAVAAGVALLVSVGVYNLLAKREPDFVKMRRSVVMLTNMEQTGGGTGFEVRSGDRSFVLTNAHVCDSVKGDLMLAHSPTIGQALARKIKSSEKYDLCLMESLGLEPLDLTDRRPVAYNDVIAVGHGLLGPATPTVGQFLEEGIIELGRIADEEGCKANETERKIDVIFFQISVCMRAMQVGVTSTIIYPGNSGSPAVDEDGEVVGIYNAGSQESHRGVYVPTRHIKEFLLRRE